MTLFLRAIVPTHDITLTLPNNNDADQLAYADGRIYTLDTDSDARKIFAYSTTTKQHISNYDIPINQFINNVKGLTVNTTRSNCLVYGSNELGKSWSPRKQFVCVYMTDGFGIGETVGNLQSTFFTDRKIPTIIDAIAEKKLSLHNVFVEMFYILDNSHNIIYAYYNRAYARIFNISLDPQNKSSTDMVYYKPYNILYTIDSTAHKIFAYDTVTRHHAPNYDIPLNPSISYGGITYDETNDILYIADITNDKILAYRIINIVSSKIIGRYSIFNFTSNKVTGRYSILNFVSKKIIAKYSILNFVSNKVTAKYSIYNFISNKVTAKYSILNFVSKKIIAKYSILNFVSNKITGRYSIFDVNPLASARRMFLRLYDRQRPVYLKALD